MIFTVYNYREFNNSNKHEWVKSWNEMVNEDYDFCKNNHTVIPEEIKVSDLPSYHPYWKNKVRKDTLKTIKRHEDNYKECLKDPDRIKYLYNIDTTLEGIRDKITNLEKKLIII